MHKITAALVLMVCFSSWQINALDFSPEETTAKLKGNILLVTIYEAPVSDYFGEKRVGEKVLAAKIRCDSKNNPIEVLSYKEGKPVEFIKIEYNEKGLPTSRVVRRNADVKRYSYTYDGKVLKEIIELSDTEEIISVTQYSTLKQGTQLFELCRSMDNAGKITSASRTLRDEKNRELEVFSYDDQGKIGSVSIYSYSGSQTTIKNYDEESELRSIMTIKESDKGDTIAFSWQWSGDLAMLSNSKTRYEYAYDKNGNWIERIEYESTEKYGREQIEPVEYIYREIKLRSLSTDTIATLEPNILYPEEGNLVTLKENAMPKVRVYEDKDPFDDLRKVTFSITANSGKAGFEDSITLIIRAKESKTTEIYINWNSYLGDDSTLVTIRFDDNPPIQENWHLSTDSKATFYPKDINTFISNMFSCEKLVVGTTPYNESPIIAEFEISDFRKVAESYRAFFIDSTDSEK